MSKNRDKKDREARPEGMLVLPVMCSRCARVYMYQSQPEARCPKCAFNRWLDVRLVVGAARTDESAKKQLLEILWRAADYVEGENTDEDLST
jgi:DNA-directed RNA polymerase subunit RPC12/RpoP